MADIGSLVVKLSAETSEFRADLGRSARLLDKHANEMKASLHQVASVAKTAFAVVIGVTSVAALRSFVTHTIEAAGALQNLSEQTGASASALSGFAPVATISGTAMEAIGGSLTKLSKGLAGVDDETAGASRALQFLGVLAKDSAGNLRDPALVMNDIALKLADFEDGAGKTAIAIDLFGKAGASTLPFLKDLAENQDLNIRLTAQQIEEADQASKALGRMRAESNFVAQTLVTSAIPSMSVLANELKNLVFGTDNAVLGIQRLRSEGTLTTWAQNTAYAIAVVIDALRGIGQTVRSVMGSFAAVWADIELAGTFLAGGKGLNPFSEENRARLKAALDKRNAVVEQANQNYVDLWQMPLLADAVAKRFEDIRKGIVAKTTQDKLKLQDKLAEITLKREKLEREVQMSSLERQIRVPAETMKDLQEQAARGQAELHAVEESIKTLRESGAISEIDSLRRLGQARQDSANQLATLVQQAREIADTAPGNEKLADALQKIGEAARQAADGATLLAQRAKELSDPEAGFAKALRSVAEEAEQVGKQIESATTRAFNGMADALVAFATTGKLDFRSLANSIISDLIRIQIQSSITKPLAGWLGSLGSLFGATGASTGASVGAPASQLLPVTMLAANGGVMSAMGPIALNRYANGGVATGPQLALFGEGRHNEAYVPLPDGRSIPVTMTGGGGGDVFNISVSVADAGAAASGNDAGGRDLGKAIAGAVRQELLAQKRAGGLLDSRRNA